MRKIDILRSAFIVMFAAFALCACTEKEPEPGPEDPGTENPENPENPEDPENPENPEDPEGPDTPSYPGDSLELNTLCSDGQTADIKGAVAGLYWDRLEKEHIYVAVTADEGVYDSSEAVQMQSRYMYMLIDKSLVGKTINLLTETSDFTVTVGWGQTVVSHSSIIVANGATSLTYGAARVSDDNGDGRYEFAFEIVTDTGAAYSMKAEAAVSEEFRDEVNHNTISYSGSPSGDSPVRASYYDPGAEGRHTIWLTSGGVYDYGEMIRLAANYVEISVPAAMADGRKIDLASGNSDVKVLLTDNLNGIEFSAVSGTLEFTKKSGEGEFEVHLSSTISATAYRALLSIDFDGVCTTNAYEWVNPNEYTYNGRTAELHTAYLEKASADEWFVYLSEKSGATLNDVKNDSATVRVSAPASYFGESESLHGFSGVTGDIPMTFACGTDKWTSTASDFGTLTCWLKGETIHIQLSNVGHGSPQGTLKVYYEGWVTIVE